MTNLRIGQSSAYGELNIPGIGTLDLGQYTGDTNVNVGLNSQTLLIIAAVAVAALLLLSGGKK